MDNIISNPFAAEVSLIPFLPRFDNPFLNKIAEKIEKIAEEVEKRVRDRIGQRVSLSVEISTRVVPVVERTIKFVENLANLNMVTTANTISQVYHRSLDGFQNFFSVIKDIFKGMGEYKIFPIISLPFVAIDLAMKIKKFVKGIIKENCVNKLVDKGMAVIGTAIDLTGVIAGIVANALFGAVTGFLSAINVIILSKKLFNNVNVYRNSIKTQDYGVNPLGNIDKRDFKKFLEPKNAREMIDKVGDIWANPNTPQDVKDQITTGIRIRSIQKIVSNSLRILPAIINIVASAILVSCPTLAVVAFGLYALSSLIILTDFVADQIISKVWESNIENHHQLWKLPTEQQVENVDDIELETLVA
jgi:hypothetical protein